MKIYTKTGDKGETALVGGKRVLKSDVRIDLYGEVDHLNSMLGLLGASTEIPLIAELQAALFCLGSQLACESSEWEKYKIPSLDSKLIQILEDEMDKMNSDLAPLKNFVLPGGCEEASRAHLCRSVCRLVERKLVQFVQSFPREEPEQAIVFLNRLSDYFFVLARYFNKKKNIADVLWRGK
ncbi:MAG: cob(I)yrinic acid a,c-diamide adenosyltransferase [Halobacteriovoraceae bacterium]|nr:cob(I)yrinic acid a,c-diamide adenosyltransferase [Halobacteriovoraceae bacterium]